jgi:Cytochrome P450
MELALPSLQHLFTSLLIILLFLRFLKKKLTCSKSKLPPGPWTLPFIGNLHQLAATKLPLHHVMHGLAKLYGPVMLLHAGETDLVVLTSREAAKEVIFDKRKIVKSRRN